MGTRVATYTLLVGLFFSLLALSQRVAGFRVPGNQQGYEPVQPISFSHRLHSGELQIDCLYCHGAAETSRHAGIPATSVCMNCHRFVKANWGAVKEEERRATEEDRPAQEVVSPEIAKIYRSMGPDWVEGPDAEAKPIAWIRVHNLPDFTYFDHRAHLAAGLSCQACHGPVETMERVRQHETLSMGWCVNCHRQASQNGVKGAAVDASVDCGTCHY